MITSKHIILMCLLGSKVFDHLHDLNMHDVNLSEKQEALAAARNRALIPASGTPASDLLCPPPVETESRRKRKEQVMIHSPLLNPFNIKSKFQPWSQEDQDHADKRLALWIATSTLPVSMVRNPNMEGFLKVLNPKVILHCHQFLISLKLYM